MREIFFFSSNTFIFIDYTLDEMDSYSITVGIDPSINSTGVCVYSYINGKSAVKRYYCIGANCPGSKPSKATL